MVQTVNIQKWFLSPLLWRKYIEFGRRESERNETRLDTATSVLL